VGRTLEQLLQKIRKVPFGINRKSFAMLIMTNRNLKDAATRKITASRKFIVFFNKLGLGLKRIGPDYRRFHLTFGKAYLSDGLLCFAPFSRLTKSLNCC